MRLIGIGEHVYIIFYLGVSNMKAIMTTFWGSHFFDRISEALVNLMCVDYLLLRRSLEDVYTFEFCLITHLSIV